MEEPKCIICNNKEKDFVFKKPSGSGDEFTLVRCKGCGLEFVSPRPEIDEMGKYYSAEYFSKRTDRGYDNYFSEKIKNEITRVIALNLKDLGFFDFEKKISSKTKALEIGCAAGYFVEYLDKRGWDSRGIDISRECVEFACESGLNVVAGDYLNKVFTDKFHLIALWASIEHLHHPHLFLEKAYNELEENGMIYISTCRTGGINFMKFFNRDWRFYNFPEHLYFFSYSTIKKVLNQNGFKIVKYKTYGSGFGSAGSVLRKLSDILAKRMYMGDMMLIAAEKK